MPLECALAALAALAPTTVAAATTPSTPPSNSAARGDVELDVGGGWLKRITRRKGGASEGHLDVYLTPPSRFVGAKRLRSTDDLIKFLCENASALDGLDPDHVNFQKTFLVTEGVTKEKLLAAIDYVRANAGADGRTDLSGFVYKGSKSKNKAGKKRAHPDKDIYKKKSEGPSASKKQPPPKEDSPKKKGASKKEGSSAEEGDSFCLDCESCPVPSCNHCSHPRVLLPGGPGAVASHRSATRHRRFQSIDTFLRMTLRVRVADAAYSPRYGDKVRKRFKTGVKSKEIEAPRQLDRSRKCRVPGCAFKTSQVLEVFSHIREEHLHAKK